MSNFKVVEKDNKLAVHCHTWSKERAEQWIERYGDSKMFTDKTLTKQSFIVVEDQLTGTLPSPLSGAFLCLQ